MFTMSKGKEIHDKQLTVLESFKSNLGYNLLLSLLRFYARNRCHRRCSARRLQNADERMDGILQQS